MKLRMPRLRAAAPRLRLPRIPAAARRLGARAVSAARKWARRVPRFTLPGGRQPPQQQEQERVREPLKHRLQRYRERWQNRHRGHGWQTPVRGESLARMMAAARAVEQHRVRAPFAPAGRHLRAPSRVPAPRVSRCIPTPRPRLPRFRRGR